MRFATNRVPVLAQVLCTLALGCAALLGPPASASAGTILTFGQTLPTPPTDFVRAEFSDDTATLTTVGVSNPVISPTSIPIQITQLGDTPIPPGFLPTAFETFVDPGLKSSTPQGNSNAKGGFSGEIRISELSAAQGFGTNILTATFSGNGILTATGGSGALLVPENVAFTSDIPQIQALIAGFPGALSLSFTPTPFQGIPFTSFTAQNSGVFQTVIPEPASVVMMGLGLMGVLGYGSLRHRSSKA